MEQRIIKFRAWENNGNYMFKWDSLKDHRELGIILRGDYINYNIMQFTGLLDKNGKEIYEGDIVKFENTINMVVGFSNGCFTINNVTPESSLINKILQYGECEIIGNIFESPNLLSLE